MQNSTLGPIKNERLCHILFSYLGRIFLEEKKLREEKLIFKLSTFKS